MLQRARFSAAERCGNLKLFPPPSLTISASTRCFMSKRSLSFSSAPSQPGWWGSSWRRRTSCRALCALESRAASWAAAPCTPGGVQPARPWSGHRPAWLPASPPSRPARAACPERFLWCPLPLLTRRVVAVKPNVGPGLYFSKFESKYFRFDGVSKFVKIL